MTARLYALDGLRAVAILFVVGSHFITQQIPGGFGVTLFFFISGFIITRLLLEDASILPFYVRRFFRLGPTLVVFVVATCAVGPVVWSDVRAALLYYANFHTFTMPTLDVTWSLAIEEHFYFLFPAVLVALTIRRLQAFLLAFMVVALAWRLVLVLGFGEIERIHRASDTRLDSIAYGCLLSVMFVRPQCKRLLDALSTRWALAGAAAVIVLCFVIRAPAFRETARYSLQGLAFMPLFCALFWADTVPAVRRALSARVMVFVGAISYSLYLYHEFGVALGLGTGIASLAVGIATTLASHYLVEVPTRRFGSRLAARLAAGQRDLRRGADEGAP
jgi:peptidoglycan/LPS O-acetylase OafA/YrhL